MTLNREDFPEMSDEQWNAIVAEGDRRASQASQTAAKGKVAETEVQARIDAALTAERARLEASEAERLEMERKDITEQRDAIERDKRTLAATKKLSAAGFSEERIETLLPLFAGADQAKLDTTLDGFITSFNDMKKAEVDAVRQELLGNATPPAGQKGGPVDTNTEVAQLIESGDTAGALDKMLEGAGYTPPK